MSVAPSIRSFDSSALEIQTLSDFPLPGGAPLLPPTTYQRASFKPSPNLSSSSFSPRPNPSSTVSPSSSGPNLSASTISSGATTPRASVVDDTKPVDKEPDDSDAHSGFDDGPLYILQPKVYTPKTASPAVMRPDTPPSDDETKRRTITPSIHIPPPQEQPKTQGEEPTQRRTLTQSVQDAMGLQKRTSLRQRVSLKRSPPESIQIPPRNFAEAHPIHQSPANTTHRSIRSQGTDHTRGSELEVQQPHRLPRASSHADFSAPRLPPILPSPHSEYQQTYHPVRASPHSPLQQRPHTAGPADQYHPSGYFQGHQRNQPSRMGGMSTLSSVTTATNDDAATVTSRATTQAGGKRVKKKKSAFGWLKKAFSLDEDEKAEYEARKAMQYQNQYQNQYYDGHSPKFLDGKRIR